MMVVIATCLVMTSHVLMQAVLPGNTQELNPEVHVAQGWAVLVFVRGGDSAMEAFR